MSSLFQELDFRSTPIGDLSLRRRRQQSLGAEVYEIKLGDEYLMSSLFTASERALGRLGVAAVAAGAKASAENAAGEAHSGASAGAPGGAAAAADEHSAAGALEVVVGGLGLGYTAEAVLEHEVVGSLVVVEALEAVIEWHRSGLLPLGTELTADRRCRFVHGDFFALAASESGFDPERPARRFDAVLVDIDHSPELLLDERSESFYRPDGLRRVTAHLKPGGVFGLWSNDRPDPAFTERLEAAFGSARAEPVTFHNPLQDRDYTQTVYVACTPST